ASVAIPFAMGVALALLLFAGYGPANKGVLGFALFMGIAMSITAFPVLVRIIQEHRLMQTPLATMAITCAAVNDVAGWCLLAILGKLGGTTLAARFTGQGWRNAFALGALMNTRGLIELIVLNLGYDLGILGPKIFTMMVVMAVLTTMMAGPILNLLKPLGSR